MNELIKYINEGYTTCISCTGAHLAQYLVDSLPNYKNSLYSCEENEKLLVFTYLTHYEPCDFHITYSEEYTLGDHHFPGIKRPWPCITVFLHSQDINFEKDILKFKELLNKI